MSPTSSFSPPVPAPPPPTSTVAATTDPSRPRTLVLCFDGTAGQYDGYNTNAVKFFALLEKDDWRQQLCYYQSGIGTYFNPGVVAPVFQWCAKILDEAFAIYINTHVMDGYRFLMANYHQGDKICLFGFSRGAYTARALAGMLHQVGLLPKDNEEQIPFAYKLYKDTSAAGVQLAAGYKQTFCQDVAIDFMGVWDTVDSVGIITSRTLPFTAVNSSIRTFRHAVALDERRLRFIPYLYEPKPGQPANGKPAHYRTDVAEVWFAGCHGDIGGGSVENAVARSLSDITLRWMVREVMRSDCDVLWDSVALERAGIPPALDSSADGVDAADAAAPMFDGLAPLSPWWVFEVVPLFWPIQTAAGNWKSKFGFHFGKGRAIADPNPNFHVTVKERMANVQLKYKPKAKWTAGSEVYVQ